MKGTDKMLDALRQACNFKIRQNKMAMLIKTTDVSGRRWPANLETLQDSNDNERPAFRKVDALRQLRTALAALHADIAHNG